MGSGVYNTQKWVRIFSQKHSEICGWLVQNIKLTFSIMNLVNPPSPLLDLNPYLSTELGGLAGLTTKHNAPFKKKQN